MNTSKQAFGWVRDLPDIRDYHAASEKVAGILKHSKALKGVSKAKPASVDLRPWCSPVEHQGDLSSCTAHAGVGMVEYFQRRAFGKHLDASRLFLYKTTRSLARLSGDSGAELRDTMKAMVLFGMPPESHWPYDIARFDEEPSAFLYAYAQSYQSLVYYRLDPLGLPLPSLLAALKANLAAGLPAMFGFAVYDSFPMPDDGRDEIPLPAPNERTEEGHAVLAVGYDDNKKVGPDKGALLIRNSWGTTWGDHGYGWMPYKYVLSGLASDFWSLVRAEFVDSDLFQ